MKKYNLKLVRQGVSVMVIMFVVIAALALMVVLAITGRDLSKLAALTMIISFISGFTYLLYKYYDRLLIKYNQTVQIDDNYLYFGTVKYKWADLQWFKNDRSSAIMHSFSIKFIGERSLKFHVTNKESQELDAWLTMKEDVVRIIKEKSLQLKNYYNSRSWRRLARIVLASNVVIPLIIFLLDVNLSLSKLLPSLMIWFATSITFAMNVFMNQKVKSIQ